ncbi:MAG: hypothetical protein NC048_00590 [Bacteroides sp.]|nr:hypothetical protein [Ruminococcus flavefaciens]MCM1553978.1 hypothetical protein [Bacteroides sp.]
MKSKELQLQLIDSLDHVVAHVEDMVTDTNAVTRVGIDTLKSDIEHLLQVVQEIEKAELESPESSVRKMKDSVEELKRKLANFEAGEPEAGHRQEPEEKLADEADVLPIRSTQANTAPEAEAEPEPKPEPMAVEAEPVAETVPAFEPVFPAPEEEKPQAQIPEPDLSDFIARPDDEPTSYVTNLTAMAQAHAGEQDMSQVAVFSTAMPDEKVVKQVEQRSDIFTKLKETGQMPICSDQNALKSLVDRLKGNKTVNDAHQPTSDDLRSLIGINEKFLFINELFKGNIKEYGDMLQALEDAQDTPAMNEVVRNLQQKYAWNEKSLAYITLSDIIKKKFGCAPQWA